MTKTHRMSGTKTHAAWKAMRQRCDNPNNPAYKYYGGNGITYEDRWELFENFLADMGEAPADMCLDRIDGNRIYSHINCRWATDAQQASNHVMQYNNTSRIQGVSFSKSGSYWKAYFGKFNQTLYQGKDFFEACCARKSWEINCKGV